MNKKPIHKVKEKIDGWILVGGGFVPSFYLKKPSGREIANFKEFGFELYPCEITYSLTKKK